MTLVTCHSATNSPSFVDTIQCQVQTSVETDFVVVETVQFSCSPSGSGEEIE